MATIPFGTSQAADARSRELWTSILGRAKNPQDVTEYLYSRRVRTGIVDADAGLPSGVNVAIEIPVRDAHLDKLLREDELTADEVAALVSLYSAWSGSSVAYAVGDIRSYNGTLYKCVQAHTSQADWQPSIVPALWTRCAPAGVIPAWQQPTGAQDAYALGAQVTHNGHVWQSQYAANVWEPGVFGWTQIG